MAATRETSRGTASSGLLSRTRRKCREQPSQIACIFTGLFVTTVALKVVLADINKRPVTVPTSCANDYDCPTRHLCISKHHLDSGQNQCRCNHFLLAGERQKEGGCGHSSETVTIVFAVLLAGITLSFLVTLNLMYSKIVKKGVLSASSTTLAYMAGCLACFVALYVSLVCRSLLLGRQQHMEGAVNFLAISFGGLFGVLCLLNLLLAWLELATSKDFVRVTNMRRTKKYFIVAGCLYFMAAVLSFKLYGSISAFCICSCVYVLGIGLGFVKTADMYKARLKKLAAATTGSVLLHSGTTGHYPSQVFSTTGNTRKTRKRYQSHTKEGGSGSHDNGAPSAVAAGPSLREVRSAPALVADSLHLQTATWDRVLGDSGAAADGFAAPATDDREGDDAPGLLLPSPASEGDLPQTPPVEKDRLLPPPSTSPGVRGRRGCPCRGSAGEFVSAFAIAEDGKAARFEPCPPDPRRPRGGLSSRERRRRKTLSSALLGSPNNQPPVTSESKELGQVARLTGQVVACSIIISLALGLGTYALWAPNTGPLLFVANAGGLATALFMFACIQHYLRGSDEQLQWISKRATKVYGRFSTTIHSRKVVPASK